MLLTIDCGNTNIVFALYKDANKPEPIVWRCQTNHKKTADEYASWLLPLLSNVNVGFSDIKHVLAASVVPDVNFNLTRLCTKYIGQDVEFINPNGSNVGVPVNLPSPVKVGADQLVNAAAAISKYGAPCVVIDFGTATTFDIVSEQGEFIGGVIAPGVNLSVEALYNAAALLPKIKIEKPNKIIGQNTIEAMQTGLYWGYVSMIEGIANRVIDEMGVKPTFIATGGLSNLFHDAMPMIDHADANLTLEGLRLIHARNNRNKSIQSVA
jgi:type III pantothenate kinase